MGLTWEQIARAKDAYIEEIRKAMGGAVDSDLVSLATTLKVRDGVAEAMKDELQLLRDFREAQVALDLLEGYHDKDVVATVRRLSHRTARAVTKFYATGECERVDLSAIRVDAPVEGA